MKTEYLLVLLFTFLFPFIRSFDKNLDIFRHLRALSATLILVSLVFWTWDAIATARGHWSFNPAYVLGFELLGLPLEEWLFFPTVSFVSIFTWESTRYFFRKRR